MKTKLLPFILLFVITGYTASSQVPQGFNYQAIATDATGHPIADKTFPVKITLQSLQTGGTIFWEEQQDVTTNKSGLFSMVVGTGTRLQGAPSFDAVAWSGQTVYLKTSIRYDGTTWTEMGAAKIWSVPYALVAETAGSVEPGKKLTVVGQDDASSEALFEVRRKDGQPVFLVYPDSVRIFVPNSQAKGAKGGFAIGGYSSAKGLPQDYFRVTPDSVRIYLDPTPAKGAKGGFAIGSYGQAKGGISDMYFNLTPSSVVNTVAGSPQILWYPMKNAFLAGNVRVASVDSVGSYSTALGYRSRASGDYSQAFGYKAIADGDFSTSIGKRSVAGSATAINAFAFGDEAKAMSTNSIAFGTRTQSTAVNALALGNGSIASGTNSTALGYQSQAQGDRSIAIGSYYSYSYLIPIINATITAPISGDDAFLPVRSITPITTYTRTFSRANLAQGQYSMAIGNGNLAQNGGFAIGTNSDATQFGAVAIGNSVRANNKNSVAIGYESKANGIYSVAIGNNVMANSFGEFALGQFGDSIVGTADTWNENELLFTIGNGTKATDRSNALTIYKNGKSIVRGKYAYSTFNNQMTRLFRILSWPYPTFEFRNYVYGVYTNINCADTNIDYYYSGYFAATNAGANYQGLFADLINTPRINATDGYFTRINGVNADVSEHFYDEYDNTEPADVVVADPDNKISVIKSSVAYQPSVVGVVTTSPMLTMGNELLKDADGNDLENPKPTTPLALTGRVPVKVTGENGIIMPGDYLTSSSTPGHAMKWTLLDVNAAADFDELKKILAENERRRNAIIGKALEGFSGQGEGKVMMLVSLQ